MSSDKPSILPPQQPSEEQEREILAWTLKERHRGAVVRKELIHWFAEGVIRRDGAKDSLAPDFVEGFLHRHPDLAKTLVVAPQPSHQRPQEENVTRGGFGPLQEMMQ